MGKNNACPHSHKKRKDSLETQAVLIEISVLFIERPKTPGITLKNVVFSVGNQLFAGDFHAVPDEINADMLQFT